MKKILPIVFLAALASPVLASKEKSLDEQALQSMKKATEFMMDKVSYNGGFVWEYLPDLSRQWGEMEAKRTMVWTQTSTPEVGHVLLDAYHATGDEYYYKMAEKVARALIWGQLDCGGWNYCFDFAGEESLKDWYRTIGANGWRLEEFQHYYGNATFDDSASTDCGKFLLRMYVEKYDPAYLGPLEKFIKFVLESQYPCGGWPQRYPLMFDHPFQGQPDYTSFVTLNDDVIPQCIDFLVQCYQSLGKQCLKEPIYRAMYVCILLQQGQPYPGWADQYTVTDLKPAGARSYEPSGLNTHTSVQMIKKMLDYYKLTGDRRFIAGIPAAIDFLESLVLTPEEYRRSGKPVSMGSAALPRFIDVTDGKIYYNHREGSNVKNGRYYHDSNIANIVGHYGNITYVNFRDLRRLYEEVASTPIETLTKDSPLLNKGLVPLKKYYKNATTDEATVREIIAGQRPDGAWISPMVWSSNVYTPTSDTTLSHETKYNVTMVGDKYDTSPFYVKDRNIPGISTSNYIRKMAALVHFIAGE